MAVTLHANTMSAVLSGNRGAVGVGIADITFNDDYTMTITLTDGSTYTSGNLRGAQGIPGIDVEYDGEELVITEGNDTISDGGEVSTIRVKGEARVIRDRVTEEMACSAYPTETASGDIVSITDGAENIPVKSLSVAVEPVQDLHGQDAPYPAGGGINKLPLGTNQNGTNNGITWSVTNGVIKLSGTSTDTVGILITLDGTVNLDPANNKIMLFNSFAAIGVNLHFRRGNTTTVHYWACNEANRVITEWTDSGNENVDTLYISAGSGVAINGTISPMLTGKTASVTAFSPYSNICPITGWDAVNVVRCGKNLIDMKGLNHTSGTVTAMTYLKKGTYYVYQFSGSSAHNTSFYYSLDGVNKTIIPTTDDGYAVAALSSASYNRQKNMITLHQDCYFALSILGNASIGENPIDVMVTTDGTGYDSFPNNAGSLSYKDSMYEPYVSTTYPIPLPSTVYGGTLDVATGVMTVDRALITLDGSEAWGYESGLFYEGTKKADSSYPDGVCSTYKVVKTYAAMTSTDFSISSTATVIRVHDSRYTAADAFKAYLSSNPVTFAYKLATPTTITLDPVAISTLLGNNTIYADAGQVTVAYRADVGLYIDKRIAEVQALVLES